MRRISLSVIFKCWKKLAFSDERGLVFNNIIDIAKVHSPKYMLLENVKHIKKISDGKVYKYDMLKKIDASEIPQEKKTDVIKKAKQEYKQEKILKKEDQKEENIIEGRRTRGNRVNYAELAGKKK